MKRYRHPVLSVALAAAVAFPSPSLAGASINGADSLCRYFLAAHAADGSMQVSPRTAERFFAKHGKSVMSAWRYNRLREDLVSSVPGVTLAFTSYDEHTAFLRTVPYEYSEAEHVTHQTALQSTHRAFFGFALTLTLIGVGALKYFNIDLGALTGVPLLSSQGIQIPLGGLLAYPIVNYLVNQLYGPSFNTFTAELERRLDKDRSSNVSALSYGHDIQGSDRKSYASIEILYAWDYLDSEPTRMLDGRKRPVVLVHLMEH